ncbi:MAG: hypothetical protein M0Q95_14540 [Porticoccaceae bacterium]|nr:hypothetical protein [Porticoccaceae bacterium]
MNVRNFLLVAALLLPSAGLFAEAESPDLADLFKQLQSSDKSADEIILELVTSGADLGLATSYAVANAENIGLSIAYAQAGVCLARDRPAAETVAQQAIESAGEQAKKAVEARVVTIINTFDQGGCELLADERNNASQAFAASPGPAGSAATGGGGAGEPPAVDEDQDVSVSQ